MTWLTWRQHRAQFAVGTAILAALCLLLVLTGLQLISQYHHHHRMRAGRR